jgi:hypothetical protein
VGTPSGSDNESDDRRGGTDGPAPATQLPRHTGYSETTRNDNSHELKQNEHFGSIVQTGHYQAVTTALDVVHASAPSGATAAVLALAVADFLSVLVRR